MRILLTDRQTDAGENITSLAEIISWPVGLVQRRCSQKLRLWRPEGFGAKGSSENKSRRLRDGLGMGRESSSPTDYEVWRNAVNSLAQSWAEPRPKTNLILSMIAKLMLLRIFKCNFTAESIKYGRIFLKLLLLLLLLMILTTSCAGGRHNMPPPSVTLTFDILTLKMVSESRVTWATSVPISVFLRLSVLD